MSGQTVPWIERDPYPEEGGLIRFAVDRRLRRDKMTREELAAEYHDFVERRNETAEDLRKLIKEQAVRQSIKERFRLWIGKKLGFDCRNCE